MSGIGLIKDDLVVASAPLPRLHSATLLTGRQIAVQFRDGSSKTVDLASVFASRRIYIPLRDNDDLFCQFRISDYGDAIEWPGGLDVSAVWLAELPDVEFNNAMFRNAMLALNMSLDGMASLLQISRRQVAKYRKNAAIPRHIAFATHYLVECHHTSEKRKG